MINSYMLLFISLLVGLYLFIGIFLNCLVIYSEYKYNDPMVVYQMLGFSLVIFDDDDIINIIQILFKPSQIIVYEFCIVFIHTITMMYIILERLYIKRNGEEIATLYNSGEVHQDGLHIGSGEYTLYKYNNTFKLYPTNLEYFGHRKDTHYISDVNRNYIHADKNTSYINIIKYKYNDILNKKVRYIDVDKLKDVLNSEFTELNDISKPEEISSIII